MLGLYIKIKPELRGISVWLYKTIPRFPTPHSKGRLLVPSFSEPDSPTEIATNEFGSTTQES